MTLLRTNPATNLDLRPPLAWATDHRALWTVQVGLALVFLFAGSLKLVLPVAEMADQSGLPAWFLRFIGSMEVLGAIGLILPALLRIRVGLVPLAAAGLVVIMCGASIVTAAEGQIAPALFPLVVGLAAAAVAYGRTRRRHETR